MMKKLLCTLLFTVFAIGFIQAQAEINVQGNGINIPDGTTTTSTADGTDFGQVNISSSSAEQLFVIQNTGTDPLIITTSVTTDPLFAITTAPTSPVAAGGNTTIGITFNAPATAGVTNATLFIFSSDSDENPYDFALTAEAVAPTGPEINVTGNGISIIGDGTNTPNTADGTDFGQVAASTSSVEQIFVIQNLGTADLTLNPSFTTNPAFQITTAPTSPVSPGGSVNIGVTFNAPATPGVVNALLFIVNGDADENPYQINLTAESVGPPNPEINVTGNGINIVGDGSNTPNVIDGTDFGQIDINTSSAEQIFVIENNGTSPLSVNPSFTTNPAFQITTPAASSVPAGGTTNIGITFNAPGSAGVVNAILFINNGDADENPYQINLTAEAVVPTAPEINVTGNGISIVGDGSNVPNTADGTDFGQVNASTSSAEQIFVIENTGTAPLTVNPSVTTNPAFAITTAAVSPVAPGGTTNIGITFNAPATPGVVNATLFITNGDADENPYQINLTAESIDVPGPEMDVFGNGVEIADGDTTPSAADDTDFGQQNVTSGSVTNTFTIQNNGTLDLNLTDPSPYVTITGANAGDFTLTLVPSTPVAASGSTTFSISFDPSALGIRTATVSIANDDSDENPYNFDIQGEGIDANAGSPLLITQYYEGTGSNQWIEIKNVSTNTVTAGSFFLALYTNLNTITSVISTTPPQQSIAIPTMAPGQVLIFNNPSATLPSAGNVNGTPIGTNVCTFDGNDVILISTTNDAGCYAARIDIMGVVGSTTPPVWGADTSFIKGCGNTESPTITFDATVNSPTDVDVNDYTELTLDEVNNADVSTNLALGTQTVGSTIYTTSWSNGLPDKTKVAIIAGTYNASAGSFETCNLTVSGNLNMNGSTTNYVKVNEDLTVTGNFTIGDTEALVMVSEAAAISGSITKLESSTTLNNYFDFTYWSSPVNGANIGTVFTGVDPNRIFQWQEPTTGSFGAWLVASGTMVNAKGYISEAPNGSTQHNISFTGTPNNGVIGKALGFDPTNTGNGGGFNLIGNPYPSAIDADVFISESDNSELDGTIWLWTHNTAFVDNPGTNMDFTVDDYATYNLTGGTAATSGGPVPSNNIGSSQGFFVRTLAAGTAFFNNPMRLDGQNNQFFRGTGSKKSGNEEKDRIWLDLTSNEGGAFNQILIGFFDEATDGFDRGYDGLRFSGGNYISFYSKIDDDRYAIQGLGAYNSDRQITLGFDTYITETFKISISNIEGVLTTEDVYLVDNELDIVHDLKASDYEFEVDETGFYTERFTLQFNNTVLGVDDELLADNFLVVNDNGTMRVRSASLLKEIKVYDVLGRKLIDVEPNVTDYPLETSSIAKGTVLIINAVLENGAEVSKKAIRY